MSKSSGSRVVVKVFLYGIQPQIWRRFSISTEATFGMLHEAIQAAMGWENKSPHEFRHGKGKRLVDVIGPVGLEDQTIGEFQDELKITIADYIGRKRLPLRLLYRYDFADEWIHEVVFESKEEVESESGPKIIEGERACPPEDFGGHFQYMQALHGEIEWMNPGYEPEVFLPEKVDFTPKKPRKRR
ncbi:plasmid pRiA4b ORF-3 family protein [Luteolibacter pohnpeiensis]|uniref:Plasmid pRiA4b ORF-3 family protein n=1 Tax=Luteolibacter pohnpeiensis TaxID=454153 RepID=A0A934S5P7_9BACT|nr:plasmid pRiA4b ORF-3 family protein [Luteolibacter pohnpeiensis]MBK1882343.1 plasmid pRiA4b ORF-3 family protein [Luteolibacter pohnpeiensis]